MQATVLLLTVWTGVAGCSSASAPQQSSQAGPPAPLIATPSGAEDVVVARVNGRPVYGSCMKAQAARGATKQQALEQCIDFELLAQQAVAFATDHDVVHETRAALVSTLIAREYEDKFKRPSDFGVYWDRSLEKNRLRIEHGEVRASAYIRIPLAKTATAAEDAAAHALADEIAAAAAKERGLMAPHLDEIAKRVLAGRGTYETAAVPPYLDNGGLVPEYARPLFDAIKEVGRTTPSAVRTPWGWDVILLTELIPAAKPTPEELVETVLPDMKRSYFPLWATQVAQRLGVTVKIYDDKVPLLESLE